MNDFWTTKYLGNPLHDWLFAIGGIIIGIALLKLLKAVIINRVKHWTAKTKATIDDFLIKIFEKSLLPVLYFLVIYASLSYLKFPEKTDKVLNIVLLLVCTFFALRLINAVIQYVILSFLQSKEDGDVKQRQAKGLLVIVKVIVWIFGIVFLLDNFGYNVTTIVAGLGIGGIAIALAAQAILGDLFSYFVILFDRPFEIGDFITVDDKIGVIEYIGIKTTRLRTLQGEELVCSNKDLTDSRLHNFKKMERRRVVFAIGVTYQTSSDTLAQIPELVKQVISKNEDVVYDRGHFSGFGDFSLNFEFVYYILSSDFNIHMDAQQRIFLEIYKAFESRNIEFAYPTQTLFINNESKIPQAEYN